MTLHPDLKISQKYTLSDLTPTNTGIENMPTEKELTSIKKLATTLEKVEAKLGPFRIPSAYRNPEVNAAVGGSSTSRHMTGEAADIVPLLQTAEKYWASILADPDLKNSLGEISYKKHQGSIHVTLPFYNSYGYLVKGSARVADDNTGTVIYTSISDQEIADVLDKYSLEPSQAGFGIGIGMLILGAGALGLAVALKRNK